jgi:hypothetical protein
VPRPRKPSAPVVPTTALVASAHRYVGKVPRIYSPSKEWQKRCYHHYRFCGEAQFAARYFGHAMGRAVLYATDQKGQRLESGPAVDHLDALFAGADGQAGMLETVGVHLVVAGECYLVGREIDGEDVWEVVSSMEIMDGPSGWQILTEEEGAWTKLEDKDIIIRVWKPAPERRWEADSPFRSMLPILDEVEWISRYIHSQTTSRLTGAGLLILPEEMTFPPPPPKDGKEQEYANEAEGFTLSLGSNMMAPIGNPDHPAAQVPLVITAPGEYIEHIKHLTFWTPLDENAMLIRDSALHRFAKGMDLPNEMIEGMSSNEGTGGGSSNGVSHWGAWMIEEQAIKMHIEPMLDVLVSALVVYYLRPLMPGSTDRIKADTTTLRLRPDRSEQAIELADRGWLKPSVAVIENNFDVSDMPDDEDLKKWLLMKWVVGSATPEMVLAAAEMLGIAMPDLAVPEVAPAPEMPELPPPPSLDDHPSRPRDPSESDYAVYEGLVLRALERAGNRLRNIHQTKTTGASWEAHTKIQANGETERCLEDAFPTAAVQLGEIRAAQVVPVLDAYCREIVESGQPYRRIDLIAWCQDEGL